jgi:uncharacterized protein (TIGR02217 family)
VAFLEIEFPRKLALGAVGGPGYNTSINSGFSGYEQRNQNWAQSRGAWTVSFENKLPADYQALLALFHAVRGRANGFRLFDPTDYSGTGQYIGTGDGSTRTFQLQKTYTFPLSSYQVVRPIQKPITTLVPDFYGVNSYTDTVVVYDNGVLRAHNAGYHSGGGAAYYTLDETTGVITFNVAPTAGHIITADFQFHWPVRFALDDLQTQYLTGVNAPGGVLVTVTGLKIVEVRIAPGSSS